MKPEELAGRNVLVTGATGFIGSHLVSALVSSGARVHAFARESSSLERLKAHGNAVTIHSGDITDRDSIEKCFRSANPEVVFHLAADLRARHADPGLEKVEGIFGVNVTGTLNVVLAAASSASVTKLVRTGSIGEYGHAATPFDELDRELPSSPYAASLVAATHLCQALQALVSFELVTVRPALVYGPGQDQRFFIAQLIRSCLDGVDFEMTEGTQTRDFVYVSDIVAGLLVVATREGLDGEVLNLASGNGHALIDVAELVVRLTGSTSGIRRGARRASDSEARDLVSLTSRARKLLGWRAEVGLEEGLRRTIDFERSRRS